MIEKFCSVLAISLFSFNCFSQETKSFEAVFTDSHLTIDGFLDEAEWQLVPAVTGFIQYEPEEGAPSARRTEVRVLFGKNDLYIGAKMHDDPKNIEQNLGRRDEYNRADWFMVSIDSYYNQKTAYTFAVNAAGVQFDGQQDDNKKLVSFNMNPLIPMGLDPSWDAIWFSEVKLGDDGWTAEIRIPYSMLRYSGSELQNWGIHFTRRIPNNGEVSEWPYIPRNVRGNLVSGYGTITGIRGLDPRRSILVRPYVLTGLDVFEDKNRPGYSDHKWKYGAGADLKIGLGPNVMLDATISPDFGQVEADPAVLNLTAFETFFTEKRPFFLEGADIFKFGIGSSRLFYSRRLGASEPIIAAAKLSGHSKKGLSFGLLGTTTGDDFSPTNNYGVFRANQTIGLYSSAGGIVTYFHSPSEKGTGWQSITGGVDWDMRFNQNKYGFEGIFAFSDRNSLEPGRKNEDGFMSALVLRKRQGIIDGHLTLLLFSENYNPNDLGWISYEQNWYQLWTNLSYKIKQGKPFGNFQRATLNMHYSRRLSYLENYDMGGGANISSTFVTRNFRTFSVGTNFSELLGGYDLWETRGLGIWAKPASFGFSGDFSSDNRKNWKIMPGVSVRMDNRKGSEYSAGLQSEFNTGTRLSFQANIWGNWEVNTTAWASNESFLSENSAWKIGNRSLSPDQLEYSDFSEFDDKGQLAEILADVDEYSPDHYYLPVFGQRDTRSLDLVLRGSLTFTNKFSLQLYTQFFVARGIYDNFSILTDPDHMADFSAYPKRRDFNYKNLQSNFVARWEYRPGSTIYFVWSHSRHKRDDMNPLAPWGESVYEQSLRGQLSDLFRIFPGNSFMIKFDYAFF